MNEAISLGDRIAVMDDGHLLQYDRPEEIVVHPATELRRRVAGQRRAAVPAAVVPHRCATSSKPGEAPGAPIAADLTLRDALEEALWTGRAALAGRRAGRRAARPGDAVRRSVRAGGATPMRLGLVIRLLVLALLVVFLVTPESFAFVFQPLTKNGQPAIYTQNALLAI